jgi:hypothetical protein
MSDRAYVTFDHNHGAFERHRVLRALHRRPYASPWIIAHHAGWKNLDGTPNYAQTLRVLQTLVRMKLAFRLHSTYAITEAGKAEIGK